MWGFLVALISGALMSIQGVFNTEMTKQTSLWVSTGWVQFSAFLVCVAAWFFTGRESIGMLWQVEDKYNLLGGVIGAFITITVIRSMGSLGPARAVMLIVISQLAVAYLIELLGIFGVERADFQWRKLLGMLIGKHKMAPVLSPKKSVEGAVGGVAGAALLGVIYAAATQGPMLEYAVICAIGALISMVGDLAASAIKRNQGIKDYGKLIPGHGGILDRFDSVIFCAPLMELLILWLPAFSKGAGA